MRKLISIDIDGTLYNDRGEITPHTKEILVRAQKKGYIVALASARPTTALCGIAESLEMKRFHGLILAYNGGIVTDYETGATMYEQTIPIVTAKDLLCHLEGFPVTPIIDDGYSIYTNQPYGFQIQYESASNRLAIKEVDDIREALDFSPAKVLIAAPEPVLARHIPAITEPFSETLSFSLSAPLYLDATPPGVNKADSLKKVCERLGIARKNVIAFGDAQNDIGMIKFAGTGISMGNACEELKKAADRHTLTNNEDGVAVALEQLGI